ncbi:hypothetical protein J27TS8_25140 [Robertmurraya siralis]|uniref:Uncharacterized protein n=1 Tax=Robertmurraya siralis TaxID=77777 RepID=A0A919WIV0_9BACI|nr:hypothetical protein [Robertmurraya siralis]GIN62521.1 hypothetical protein J27TS8_25140 [Robertmurraya siralis]
MFNEEKYKNTTKKLEVIFKRTEDDLLTSWQISDFISQLTKHYYKNELLNTISLALKHGISPKNIIIFNESFDIDYTNKNMGLLDLTTSADVKFFYSRLDALSMFPDEEITKIRLIFSYFRGINELLYQYHFSRLDKNNLIRYYNKIKKGLPYKEIINEIESLALEIVKETANVTDKEKERFRRDTKELTSNTISSFLAFEKDKPSLDILIERIEDNDSNVFKDSTYQKLERDYFKGFFTKFNSLQRPIIGIYSSENRKVQILCDSFINKTKHDPSKFLDLKSISHNSPYEAIFHIGLTIVIPLITILSVSLNSRNLLEESDTTEKEREEAEARIERTIRELEPATESEEIKAVEEIPQDYIRNKMLENYDQNTQNFVEPVKKYGFANHRIEVRVFDTSSK